MYVKPKRPTVFYGWWVVGASSLISLYTAGVIHFGFTAVFEPIANEFGWSYVQISLAASLRGLETGLLAPIVGMLVDRWGSRKLVFGGIVISGLGLVLLSRINSLGMFYAAFILIAIGISSSSATVFLTTLVHWFRRNLGIATGIATSGFALGGLLVPLVTTLIDTYGWRTSMFSLGLGVWLIGLPLSLLIRNTPEQHGYLPDGDESKSSAIDERHPPTHKPEVDIVARQALKSSAFWHIAPAFMCQIMVINAVVVHVMPYLSTVGISRASSSLVASAIPVASILGRLSSGWFADRLDKKRAAATGFVLTGLGLLLFSFVSPGRLWVILPFLLLFGIGWGASVTMRIALLREHFGRKIFGTVHGFTLGVTMVGNITGPALAGWVYDKWGSYQGIWLALVGVSAVSVLIVALTPPVSSITQLGDK
ncbi:MAG: MFS transporter [Dehalococcoidia bacterium]|nr:MFS transporter [Dehalococcoidia bacterium]